MLTAVSRSGAPPLGSPTYSCPSRRGLSSLTLLLPLLRPLPLLLLRACGREFGLGSTCQRTKYARCSIFFRLFAKLLLNRSWWLRQKGGSRRIHEEATLRSTLKYSPRRASIHSAQALAGSAARGQKPLAIDEEAREKNASRTFLKPILSF